MAITVLSTNIGVPAPVAADIVNNKDAGSSVFLLSNVVCATNGDGIWLEGGQSTVNIGGTLIAGNDGVYALDNSAVVVQASGLIHADDRGISVGSDSSIDIFGVVQSGYGIEAQTRGVIHVAESGRVAADDYDVGRGIAVGIDSLVVVDGVVTGGQGGGYGVIGYDEFVTVAVNGTVRGGIAVNLDENSTVAVSGLADGNDKGVYADSGSNISVAAGGTIVGDTGVYGFSGITLKNEGSITGRLNESVILGGDCVVDNAGTISGELGLTLQGTNSEVANSGTIFAQGGAAVVFLFGNSLLANTGTISGAIGASLAGGFSTIDNAGKIGGTARGLSITGEGNLITNSGGISAEVFEAASISGTKNRLENSGNITARGVAVSLQEDVASARSQVVNDGSISGATGVSASGAVTLSNRGEITGTSEAVTISSRSAVFANAGLVDGSVTFSKASNASNRLSNLDTGIILGSVYDKGANALNLVNRGLIDGSVLLGASADTYNGAEGSLSGTVYGEDGNDTLTGGAGRDLLDGGNDNDVLTGNGGNDQIFGGNGDDTITGGDGDDSTMASGGNDQVDCGAGNDLVIVTSADGDDDYIGGDGIDTLDFSLAFTAVFVAMANETVTGSGLGNDHFTGFENVTGSTSADIINGDAGANAIKGGSGGDLLAGAAGNDRLKGDAGVDLLVGGAGRDILTGGSESDTFRFEAPAESPTFDGADTIRDFVTLASGAPGHDTIDLSAIDANSDVAGNNAFTFIGTAAFSSGASAGQLRYSVQSNYTQIQADVNNDGLADLFILLRGVQTLAAGDFTL